MGIAGAGGEGGGGGGRAARALRFLLLLVMALAALEYLAASVFEASPRHSYLHTPTYNANATLPTFKSREKTQAWTTKPNCVTPNPVVISSVETNKNISKKIVNNNTATTTKKPLTSMKKVHETTTLVSKRADIVGKTVASSTEATNVTGSALPFCEVPYADLGPIPVNKTEIKLSSLENKFPEVTLGAGGRYKPPNCTAKHRVAIIIPYRDRPQHLAIFLNHMHPFLMRQQLDYGIFVIEQQDTKPTTNNFNRAKLFNVGFVEANRAREGGWQCFVFHDVDLLPIDERNLYTCPRQPRHMSPSLDKFNFKLIYQDLFGGVSALTYEQFVNVNGFSNKYWGWGGEDDDMSYRIRKMKYHIARYKMSIARYTMLDHKPHAANPKRYKLLSQTDKNFKQDGLSNLEYKIIKMVKHRLYTLIRVNIDEQSLWQYFARLLFGDQRYLTNI